MGRTFLANLTYTLKIKSSVCASPYGLLAYIPLAYVTRVQSMGNYMGNFEHGLGNAVQNH